MPPRKIKLHRHPAASRKFEAPLLFVHGGYVNSQCWEFNFVPFFRDLGYDCYAVDLSGHGESEGRERIDDFGIADYVEDVAWALAEIGEPAIVIGHSMGALVLERYLEGGQAVAAVLMAPVPTTGTVGSAVQLALRHPGFFAAIEDVMHGRFSEETEMIMAQVYYSRDAVPGDMTRFLPMVGTESHRAIAEMAVMPARLPKARMRLPVLVVGGAEDAVFPASMLHFSALPWHAEIYRAAGAGHLLMLDAQWQRTAAFIGNWLAKLQAAVLAA
ncbi:MAG: alpha/beta hydrolase [Betaproteobacteria bacterium]